MKRREAPDAVRAAIGRPLVAPTAGKCTLEGVEDWPIRSIVGA